jgi:hypothetical protein
MMNKTLKNYLGCPASRGIAGQSSPATRSSPRTGSAFSASRRGAVPPPRRDAEFALDGNAPLRVFDKAGVVSQ